MPLESVVARAMAFGWTGSEVSAFAIHSANRAKGSEFSVKSRASAPGSSLSPSLFIADRLIIYLKNLQIIPVRNPHLRFPHSDTARWALLIVVSCGGVFPRQYRGRGVMRTFNWNAPIF